MISDRLKTAITSDNRKSWEVAQTAGINPAYLAKYLNGSRKAFPGDLRIIRIGDVFGLPAHQCFEETAEK